VKGVCVSPNYEPQDVEDFTVINISFYPPPISTFSVESLEVQIACILHLLLPIFSKIFSLTPHPFQIPPLSQPVPVKSKIFQRPEVCYFVSFTNWYFAPPPLSLLRSFFVIESPIVFLFPLHTNFSPPPQPTGITSFRKIC